MDNRYFDREAVAKLLCSEKSKMLRPFESGSQTATPHPTRSTPSGSTEEDGLKGPKKGAFNGQMSCVTASDQEFMRHALTEAENAFAQGEVPIGAVLVLDGRIIAKAHNRVEHFRDATQHAEMLCLQRAAKSMGNWRLHNATLYCTLEPCPMCAGAMIHSRLKTLVWAAPDLRCGAHGSWINILDIAHPIHQLEVRKGVLGAEAGELMRAFFRTRRKEKI